MRAGQTWLRYGYGSHTHVIQVMCVCVSVSVCVCVCLSLSLSVLVEGLINSTAKFLWLHRHSDAECCKSNPHVIARLCQARSLSACVFVCLAYARSDSLFLSLSLFFFSLSLCGCLSPSLPLPSPSEKDTFPSWFECAMHAYSPWHEAQQQQWQT